MLRQLARPTLPDPIALLEATSHFAIQILVIQYPELLDPPDVRYAPGRRPVTHAQMLFRSLEDLHRAVDIYRACLPFAADEPDVDPSPDDDIPF